MIRRSAYIATFFLLVGLLIPVQAQFINLQLKVEPELSAAVEQPLDFGTQQSNSGQKKIDLGDLNMGIFSIRAFSNQQIYLDLRYPDYLENLNSSINDQIPLHLDMSYNNTGVNSYQESQSLIGNNGLVTVSKGGDARQSGSTWSILYIYVFGEIDVGDVANGIYNADIVLRIDYE